jgi:hypothetical protein
MPLQRWGQMDSRPHGTRKRRFAAPSHGAPKSKNPSAPLKTGLNSLGEQHSETMPPHAIGKFFHNIEISETAMTKQLAIEDCVIRFSLNRVDSYPKMKKRKLGRQWRPCQKFGKVCRPIPKPLLRQVRLSKLSSLVLPFPAPRL